VGTRIIEFRPRSLSEELKVLLDLPLSGMWRAVFQIFEFGEQKPALNRNGEEITRADYSLDVSCAWRIRKNCYIVISDVDHWTKRRFYRRKTPPRDPRQRTRWRRAQEFFEAVENQKLNARRIRLHGLAELSISLTLGYTLDVFLNDSVEGWRLLYPDKRQLVFYPQPQNGLEVYWAGV